MTTLHRPGRNTSTDRSSFALGTYDRLCHRMVVVNEPGLAAKNSSNSIMQKARSKLEISFTEPARLERALPSHALPLKKVKTCCGSQSSDPGNRPETNPPCPPWLGNCRVTAFETSLCFGRTDAGRNGSLRALMSKVGTTISLSHGLLLARFQ